MTQAAATLPSGTLAASASADSTADRSKVFALLADSMTWPAWSSFESCTLERPGETEPYGAGAIRVFRTRGTASREEVVELVPDTRLRYKLLSGLPLSEYVGNVELEPLPSGGTRITWSSTFRPKHAIFGWFWKRFLTYLYGSISKQLAKGAEAAG